MSPTVFRVKDYRFFFFSREETRAHIHISSPEGEAKFRCFYPAGITHRAESATDRLHEQRAAGTCACAI